MSVATRADALRLLGAFLDDDEHYRSTAATYGDGGRPALERALDLFLLRPELGFVWLAYVGPPRDTEAAGVCVVSYAISTARGSLVAKLDDVHVGQGWQGKGAGSAMLRALGEALRAEGVTRIDTACHRDNAGAWAFYERLGFRPLAEERITLLL
jgi:GNAT superfamily N-acetyltransferase